MKNLIKVVLIGVIIIEIVTYNNIVVASNKSDLQNEKSDLNNSISEAKDELEQIEEEKSEVLNAVESLTVEISEYETEISDLEARMQTLENQILEAQKQIEKDEEEYKKNQAALNERLVVMYENGETTYLDYFLSSSSLTDFISKYYLVSELADYDTQMLEKIEEEKNKIEEEKKTLEADKKDLNTAKETKEAKMSSLKVAKEQKQKYVNNLSAQEKETQEKIEEMQEDKALIEKQLRKIAAAEEAERKRQEEEARKAAQNKNNTSSNSSSSGKTQVPNTPSASGYIFPVQGLSKANIRNKTYPSYPGHTGIDVNINVTGKNVVAVKSGTVVESTALKNSNGTYRSYGEYIMISHGDGTVTLYAHMLAGSRKVTSGQKVSQGQAIGTVGSTGNSTGTHLHFEVQVLTNSGGTYKFKPVNPIPYLP